MQRLRRLGRVALIGLLGVVALMTEANAARDMVREFPNGEKCPVTVYAGPDDPETLTFVARGPSAKLMFIACSDTQGETTNISLDHVMVVEKSVFDANRIDYPGARIGSALEGYGIALWYKDIDFPDDPDLFDPVCYGGNPAVRSVFDRAAATPFTAAMPFYDDFENARLPWEFMYSRIGVEELDGKKDTRIPDDTGAGKSLILTRADDASCAYAGIRVNKLVKDQTYVVDFSWFVSNINNARGPRVTVCLAPYSSAIPQQQPEPGTCGTAR